MLLPNVVLSVHNIIYANTAAVLSRYYNSPMQWDYLILRHVSQFC